MSYNIYYYRPESHEETTKNINYLFESVEFGKEHVISKELMHEIKDTLLENDLKFKIFENKHGCDDLGLGFATYFINMFPGKILITIPLVKENSEESVVAEISLISETIVGKGLIGYDPNTFALITEKKPLKPTFAEWQKTIAGHLSRDFPQIEEPKSFWERLLKYVKSGVERNIRSWAFQTLIVVVGIILIIIYESYFK